MNKEEKRPPRILLVDDESVIRELLGRVLGGLGCDLVPAAGLEEALARLDGTAFDLLITDLRLPDGNGADVIRHFKARWPAASVLVITGSLTPEERLAQIQDFPLTDCIHKPFEPPVLQQAVRRALAARQA